jgi:arylsulfatase A-like enzyme
MVSGISRGSAASSAHLLGLVAMSALGLLAGCSGQDGSHEERPNVLILSVCSIRADHMSCYGYERDTTPNLTELAKESIVFDNAITQWPKTTPGFAAIMSAKYGHANGVLRTTHGPRLADEHVTMAEALHEAGFATAAFISSPALAAHANIAQQGFDVVEEVFRDRRRHTLPTERALTWLRKRDTSKPFFIWAHYNNAHYPYRGGGAPNPDMFVGDAHYDPSRRVRAITDPRMRLALPIPQDHPCRVEVLRTDMGTVHRWAVLPERPEEYAFYIARYDAGIYGADAAMGALLDGVRALGLWDNTIIAVVGDHGESLGEHNYYFEHGRFPYDATAEVPFMIRPAGGGRERRIDPPVATFRLAPTILEMLGIEPPPDWQAQSLVQLINGDASAEKVFTEVGYHADYMLVVRDNDWKLIHVPDELDRRLMQGTEYELYNWRSDPHERKNLVGANPQQAQRLASALKDWSAPWVASAYGQPQRRKIELDDETRRQLATLGYIDDASPDEDDEKDPGDDD